MSPNFSDFLKWIFIYFIFLRVSEIKITHTLIQSPNSHNSQGLIRLKPEAWKLIWVSHVGIREPSSWAVICYLSRWILTGRQNREQNQFEPRYSAVECRHPEEHLNHCVRHASRDPFLNTIQAKQYTLVNKTYEQPFCGLWTRSTLFISKQFYVAI